MSHYSSWWSWGELFPELITSDDDYVWRNSCLPPNQIAILMRIQATPSSLILNYLIFLYPFILSHLIKKSESVCLSLNQCSCTLPTWGLHNWQLTSCGGLPVNVRYDWRWRLWWWLLPERLYRYLLSLYHNNNNHHHHLIEWESNRNSDGNESFNKRFPSCPFLGIITSILMSCHRMIQVLMNLFSLHLKMWVVVYPLHTSSRIKYLLFFIHPHPT